MYNRFQINSQEKYTRHDSSFHLLFMVDLLEKEMTTHSSILAWTIPWMEEHSRLQSMGLQKLRTGLRYFTFNSIVFHRLCQYPHQESCFFSGACSSEDSNSKKIVFRAPPYSEGGAPPPPVALFLWNEIVLNATSQGLTSKGTLTTSRELQISTAEGLVSLFAKSFIFKHLHPLPCSVCVKEGSSQ